MGVCAASEELPVHLRLDQGAAIKPGCRRRSSCCTGSHRCRVTGELSGEDGDEHATICVDGHALVEVADSSALPEGQPSTVRGFSDMIAGTMDEASPALIRSLSGPGFGPRIIRDEEAPEENLVLAPTRGLFARGLGSFISSLGLSKEGLMAPPNETEPSSKKKGPVVKFDIGSHDSQAGNRNNTPVKAADTIADDTIGGPSPRPTQLATMDDHVTGRVADADEEGVSQPPSENQADSLLAMMKRTPSTALRIIIENPRSIDNVYKVEAVQLGKGAFGSVKKARVRATGGVRAVKFVLKSRMKGKEFLLVNEIEILKCVDHPNVIKLYELFEDSEYIYMVMELCSGGALVDHLKRSGRFTEKEAAKSMVQILRAMYYLHMHDICHRDMKPANCLIVTRDLVEKSTLRVTDFGLSCRCTENQIMTDRVGTLAFMSPQVIGRKYDRSCDTWSCGVTMYMLLSGRAPFPGKSDEEIRAKITSGVFTFEAETWLDVSEDGMSLIRKMLRVNTKARSTIKEALECEWLRKKAREAEPQPALDMSILRNLQGFRALNRFKRAALCIIASMLDEEQTKEARDMFIMLDTDDDGRLDHEELRVRLMNEEGEELEVDLGEVERTKSMEPYTYTEFLAATFDRTAYCQRGVCWAAFNSFDANNDGCISAKELVKGWVLGDLTDDETEHLVKQFDADANGTIDFQEFMEMMRDGEGWTPSMRSPRSPSNGSRNQGFGPDSPRTVASAFRERRSNSMCNESNKQGALPNIGLARGSSHHALGGLARGSSNHTLGGGVMTRGSSTHTLGGGRSGALSPKGSEFQDINGQNKSSALRDYLKGSNPTSGGPVCAKKKTGGMSLLQGLTVSKVKR